MKIHPLLPSVEIEKIDDHCYQVIGLHSRKPWTISGSTRKKAIKKTKEHIEEAIRIRGIDEVKGFMQRFEENHG